MQIAIVGAGRIGGFLAANLNPTRHDVQLVARGALAHAREIGLDDDEVEQATSFVEAQPHHATSSLQRDLAARRPSELDAWTGAIVRLGEQSGVPTPINTVLHQLLVPRLAQ